ncbi:MAG: ABC transporter ATP-binding protein [Treponemataceae bacterium]
MSIIEIRGVHKEYLSGDEKVPALRGVDLNIERGQFIAIAGPSGSGKTTLLNLLGCLDSLDSGSIHIDSADVAAMDSKERARFRREKLGFVFQSYNLIPVLSVLENVAFPLRLLDLNEKEVKMRCMEILAEVGLADKAARLPGRLSGGQQQRVAVARALVKRPALVLADEPTANLDSATGSAILDMMKAMNEKHGTTFVFSTHDKMVMDRATRLVMLHDGLIVSDGSPS